MGFWVFMLIMDLLIPLTLIGFGKYFLKTAPKKITVLFGYRTAMSMKNRDTWGFAHQYCGKMWYFCGWILLPISILVMLSVIGKTEDTVGGVGGLLCAIQALPLIGSVFLTEKALKKTFDENGSRK